MSIPPLSPNEHARLESLYSYDILDTLSEKEFDELTELASVICGTSISLISMVDKDRQWFKSKKGLAASETPIEQSFCAHAIVGEQEIMVIHDAHEDPRFKDNPLVTGDPRITFYAGVPLVNKEGFALGTLCVIDPEKKELTTNQISALKILGKQFMERLESRKAMQLLESGNQVLTARQAVDAAAYEAIVLNNVFVNALIEQAPVGICVIRTADLMVVAVNNGYLELVGKGRDDFHKKTIWDSVPEAAEAYAPIMAEVIRTGNPFIGKEHELRLVRQSKLEQVFFNFVYEPLKEVDGSILYIMVVVIEVSEQVKSRRIVQELNEELATINEEQTAINEELIATIEELQTTRETLIESQFELERVYEQAQLSKQAAELGIFDMDVVNNTLEWDARCRTLFGISHSGQVTYEHDFLIGLYPEDRDRVVRIIGDVFNKQLTNGNYDIEYRTVGVEDGKIRWIRAKGQTFFNAKDEPLRFIGVVLDISEQKQNDQLKNDFIAMVSHELKTPLTSMGGYLQMLAMMAKKDDNPMRVNTIENARNQVAKMTKMISGFLDVSRLEAGKIYIDHERFDMKDLVKEIEEETVPANSTHTIIFAPVLTTWVNGDRDKIGQVITNFISNALKYSSPGTMVQIACLAANGCSQVSVRDEGMGIAAKDIDKLFDRYYRVEGHQLKSISGFGIGLYLCSEIIKRHDGKVWVESEPSKGSNFYFSIPVVD